MKKIYKVLSAVILGLMAFEMKAGVGSIEGFIVTILFLALLPQVFVTTYIVRKSKEPIAFQFLSAISIPVIVFTALSVIDELFKNRGSGGIYYSNYSNTPLYPIFMIGVPIILQVALWILLFRKNKNLWIKLSLISVLYPLAIALIIKIFF